MTQEQQDCQKPRFFHDDDEKAVIDAPEPEVRKLFVEEESDKEISIKDDDESERLRFYRLLKEIAGTDSLPVKDLYSYWHKYGKLENGLAIATNKYFEEKEIRERRAKKDDIVVINISDSDEDSDLSVLPSRITPTFSSKRSSSQAEILEDEGEEKSKRSDTWSKYIGSIHSIGMATRPTVKPVAVGSRLGFKKAVPKETHFSKSSQGSSCSHLIRLIDISQNRELGRVPEELARILNPLLEYREVIQFETFLLNNDGKRLSVGDDLYIRVDCYLTSNAFHLVDNKNVVNNLFGRNRTMDFKQLHRAESIMGLFDAINIQPVYGDTEHETISDSVQDTNFANSQFQEEALNINQLKRFYRITQSADSLQRLPETSPDESLFKINLRRYQKQSLSWMLKREYEYTHLSKEALDISIDGNSMNPLWKRFKWPSKSNNERNVGPAGEYFYANLYTGEFSIEKPVIKTMINGGFLADEMGLGKTISTLALICTADHDKEYKNDLETARGLSISDLSAKPGTDLISQNPLELLKSQSKISSYAYRTTLIIVPMSLLNQWQSEFEKANNDPKKRCEIYYGNNIKNFKSYLLGQNPPSVIITTYGIVQSEYGRSADNGIFSVSFFRIILDEGHTIRNRSTRTSKAVIALQGSRKWILTGTPIINRLDDLFSQVQFLNLEPWSHINYWKRFVTVPFEKGKYDQSFDVINAVLEPVLLRRTKNMKDVDGQPLVSLPPKEVLIEKLQLSPTEKRVYQSLLKDAENSVKEGLEKGDLLKNYTNILVHILRLRQVCCHLTLLKKKPTDDDDLHNLEDDQIEDVTINLTQTDEPPSQLSQKKLAGFTHAFRDIYDSSNETQSFECAICTTESIKPLSVISVTECLHTFCESCLIEYMDFQRNKSLPINCPYCREPIKEESIMKLKEPVDTVNGYELTSFGAQYQSSKEKASFIEASQKNS